VLFRRSDRMQAVKLGLTGFLAFLALGATRSQRVASATAAASARADSRGPVTDAETGSRVPGAFVGWSRSSRREAA
jgi:hypothetical protein